MSENLTVSEAAREIGKEIGMEIQPRQISDLLYARAVPDDLCPIVGGRRLIPRHCLPAIAEALRSRGKLRPAGARKDI